MRPVIGLIPLFDDEKESYWMLPGYMKAIEKSGGVPIMLPFSQDENELIIAYGLCDGILFTGGHDVSPKIYGQGPTDKCGITCETRDAMEGFLLDLCISDNKPMLGICRGIQFINAYLGGTLYQDLPTEYKSNIEHHMTPPYDNSIHNVDVKDKSKLANIIGAGIHSVNSYHHQAIKELADGLEAMAISEDGLVESIAIKNQKFAIAVQWHPEFSYGSSEDSKKIMKAFVDSCM
ncbi:MAG: gamma-glutamyl-gamma-aminobutyrate hydrolase family protein [Pseudobutyrivibrio sp.]|uniref:gamma-glutamyl-gamma-aminobutyrate hydrolase family protein n=1 Tax=Pseudobutyrivibrio sp. TaxID=2014367 RepID=UPI001B053124|nr:gamma-glutamyl-gamma-aminobutyrate hydrolase family protein [Pseudobutyrivibrio sp.]MBO6129119.1 gamma-glutamyl-gamma-aminobutyrate hydrolase family protein [Pseudobutyrivibrio sp.]MBQ8489159.1 gamma-glutamyl-gamma-aminobutyrate hydrolase family protein [Pseudobutyrivibrio sp.]